MKQTMILTFVLFAAGLTAARAASSPEEVVANLIVGKCLSEKTSTALPAGTIDPAKVGTPLTERDRDPRLGKQALRIPSASGAVYYDHKGESCLVHAAGVDTARTLANLQGALDRAGLKAEKHNVTIDGGKNAGDPSVMRITAMYLIETPADDLAFPLITITSVPAYPSILTVGLVLSRKQ